MFKKLYNIILPGLYVLLQIYIVFFLINNRLCLYYVVTYFSVLLIVRYFIGQKF